MAWGQRAEAVAALERLRANSEIAAAWVFELPDRRTIFAQSPREAAIPDALGPLVEGATFLGGELWLVRDLRAAGRGRVRGPGVAFPPEGLRRERTHSFVILFTVMLALVLPAVAAATYLTRSLIGPIAALANTVHAITKHEDQRLRRECLSSDEIGRLAGDFNRMLDALERQDAALVASERNYREMFDASNDPICHDSSTGAILDANRAAVARDGATPGRNSPACPSDLSAPGIRPGPRPGPRSTSAGRSRRARRCSSGWPGRDVEACSGSKWRFEAPDSGGQGRVLRGPGHLRAQTRPGGAPGKRGTVPLAGRGSRRPSRPGIRSHAARLFSGTRPA